MYEEQRERNTKWHDINQPNKCSDVLTGCFFVQHEEELSGRAISKKSYKRTNSNTYNYKNAKEF